MLDDEFARVLDRVRIPLPIVEWASGELRKERDSIDAHRDTRLERLRKEESKLLKRLEALYVDKVDGELAVDTYKSLKAKADDELVRMRGAMASIDLPMADDCLDPLALLELAATAGNRFKSANSDLKRELVASVCSNSTYTEHGVQVCLQKPFDIFARSVEAASQKGGNWEETGEWLPD